MVITSLAGSTALQAKANTATMAEKDCLLGLTGIEVLTRFKFAWASEPLDVCKALEKISAHLLACFSIFE